MLFNVPVLFLACEYAIISKKSRLSCVWIAYRFKHDDEEGAELDDDSFKYFVGVINEYRNSAAHEGEYWEYCFNNNFDGYLVPPVVRIDLENFSGRDEKKKALFHY